MTCDLSIIIPTLNEGPVIAATLAALQPLRDVGVELIVVDGGSIDDTRVQAEGQVDHCLCSPPGRARQMNAGAARAGGRFLCFLHADTQLPVRAAEQICANLDGAAQWGRFDVRLAGRSRCLPVIAGFMNARSRLTRIATGDQALFMRRGLFVASGGFAPVPLMEDILLSSSLRRMASPACLRSKVTTSARRWEQDGLLRTVGLMWRLRLAFFLGASPESLAARYRPHRCPNAAS